MAWKDADSWMKKTIYEMLNLNLSFLTLALKLMLKVINSSMINIITHQIVFYYKNL